MEYVVGSVAALISGNVTPNRPKLVRRALTPTKHQPSPNVTPKSEFVEDRSIFLSPTQQKKKAIVKKSPKRIFQNPDLDVTEGGEGNSSLSSPKAEKVKKHLKDELEAENMSKKKSKSPNCTLDKSSDDVSPSKKSKIEANSSVTVGTPKKKKNKRNSESNVNESDNATSVNANTSEVVESVTKSPKKKNRKSISENVQNSPSNNIEQIQENSTSETIQNESGNKNENKKNKKKKKNKKPQQIVEKDNKENNQMTTETVTGDNISNKKMKNKKNKKNKAKNTSTKPQTEEKMEVDNQEKDDSESESEEIKAKNIPNPNAITEKDSDSEHDSDDEIESENEQENEKVLTNEKPEESSDEEEEEEKSKSSKNKPKEKSQEEKSQVMTEDEVKRTLFVGNVPFSKKCKKEIKKIFSKYGQIDTIRIRTIPVKDARVTPKLAIIRNELHPDRTTVNVYIKYADASSVGKAIAENNTVLNGNHLRVSRSDSTGTEHDPRCAVFVGNLPFAVEDDVLRSKFDKCGQIESVRVIRDKKTNAGKGFGYINFASKDGVELALALTEEDLTIKNRIIRVKRCTQTQGKPGKEGRQGNQGGRQGNFGGRQGSQRGRQGNFGGRQGNQRGRPVSQGDRQRSQDMRQGNRGGWQGNQGGRQGNQGGRPENQGGGKWGQQGENQGPEGAARRLMNKRKFQESSSVEGPPKEKKQRKEFVGITADKKKKHKFDKGQKKKKALSEILTKSS